MSQVPVITLYPNTALDKEEEEEEEAEEEEEEEEGGGGGGKHGRVKQRRYTPSLLINSCIAVF